MSYLTGGWAVGEFNRYNRRQLKIADPALESLQVGGNFRATDVESFVGALERSFAIHAAQDSNGDFELGRLSP